jgi:alkaline phosphatase D
MSITSMKNALTLSLLLTVTSASGQTWPNPLTNEVIPVQSTPLTHGPILGRPDAHAIRVWIRTRDPGPFEVVYSTNPNLGDKPLTVAGRTLADQDNTGFVDLSELQANTRYYYGVRFGENIADTRIEFDRPWPSFVTLPDSTSQADEKSNPKGLFNFTFSIGACQRQRSPKDTFGIYANPPSFLNLWKRHGDQIAFHVVNGDYTYEELLDGTRAGYENNYKLYLSRGRNVSNLLRYIPMMVMYDDHEVNSNTDGAGEPGLGDGDYLVRDAGLEVWDYYAQWANPDSVARGKIRFGQAKMAKGSSLLIDRSADFSDLKPSQVSTIHLGNYIKKDKRSKAERGGANIGVYGLVEIVDKHTLRVTPAFRETGSGSYSIGTHHYFDKKIGNCHFFFVDTRAERAKFLGPEKSHDADRFILGDVQRKWLLEGVSNTDAAMIFIVSPDPWVIYHTGFHGNPTQTKSKGDGFAGYVHEREQMLPVFDKIEKPILIFTGDVHHPFAAQISDNVWEFLCSPMNSAGHPLGTAGLPPLGGWFDSEGRKVKIKWAGGLPDNVHYLRQRQTFYTLVQVNNVVTTPTRSGTGVQHIAYDEPQVVVSFYDGFTGRMLYAEGISTVDARSDKTAAPKKSKWPAKDLPGNRGF